MAKNKKNTTPHYEMLYIVPNKYTEDDVTRIKESVVKMIEKNAGKITFSEDWGKKKFCYPIKHTMHGYYLLVEFDMVAENVANLSTELRMSHEVLRHMIVNTIEKTEEQRQIERDRFEASKKEAQAEKAAPARATTAKASTEAPKAKKEEAKVKVDTKELDEKLNKILDTDDLL